MKFELKLVLIALSMDLIKSSSFMDNYIIGTPNVICEENDVALDIITHKPFSGNIFVKGRAKDSSCRQSYSNSSSNGNNNYSLPLGHCGMQRLRSANPRGINFAVTVIVSFHPQGFITKNDRAFHVRCFYMEPDEIVTNSFEVSQLPTQELNDEMGMPTCEYSVHSNSIDGPLLSYASVGETVYHVWECKGSEMGLLVKKCFVTDGDGEDHAVVDYDGCTLDTSLLSQITYEKNSMRAYAQSQAFKYADSNQLYFTCQIRLCQKQMDMCEGITPPKCGKNKVDKEDLTKPKSEFVVSEAAPSENLHEKLPEEEDETEDELTTNSTKTKKSIRNKRDIHNSHSTVAYNQRRSIEMDVASPEMLIFDRDERQKIQQQRQQQHHRRNVTTITPEEKQQTRKDLSINDASMPIEKLCFVKDQLFYITPAFVGLIVFTTILLTLACCSGNNRISHQTFRSFDEALDSKDKINFGMPKEFLFNKGNIFP